MFLLSPMTSTMLDCVSTEATYNESTLNRWRHISCRSYQKQDNEFMCMPRILGLCWSRMMRRLITQTDTIRGSDWPWAKTLLRFVHIRGLSFVRTTQCSWIATKARCYVDTMQRLSGQHERVNRFPITWIAFTRLNAITINAF